MSHDPHEALPGYAPGQILIDGCHECETRSGNRDRGIGRLDEQQFAAAWKRAAAWNRGVIRVSAAEVPMLSVLLEVQFQLERRGIPIGEVPHA